jgi:outer membrane protein
MREGGVREYLSAIASLFLAGAGLGIGCSQPAADTLEWALVQAYQNNPSLNAQRAALRATDENVPQALSGYRPKLSVTALGSYNSQSQSSVLVLPPSTPTTTQFSQVFFSNSIGANASYTLYNGFQTANRTRMAESQVEGARETLRVTEQQVLLDAATAYMNLLRDQALLDIDRRYVQGLIDLLRQTRDRFTTGELSRTDVAQAETRLAINRFSLLNAQSNYLTSQANYRRVIGVEPGKLVPGSPVDRLSPNTLAKAIAQGQAQSPSVLAAMYGVDAAELQVKISEGALYPNVTVTASALQGTNPAFEVLKESQVAIAGSVTIPIYQGGGEYSTIRQNKESLGQQRLTVDTNRDQARATVVQSWAQRDAAQSQIAAAMAAVNAAEVALNGVREEARLGQRTTYDILNAEQDLVSARNALVTAEHDRVVASYALLAAVGGLSVQRLGLAVVIYDPMVHYQQIRDAWIGVRNPDGR